MTSQAVKGSRKILALCLLMLLLGFSLLPNKLPFVFQSFIDLLKVFLLVVVKQWSLAALDFLDLSVWTQT